MKIKFMLLCNSLAAFVLSSLLLAPTCLAVTVPSIFGDQMVLQRDAKVPIWGTANPNAKITVRLGAIEVKTEADGAGNWMALLDPMTASSQAQTLTITSDQNERNVSLANVLIGDVWIGSGQSNMAGRVSSYAKNDQTLAEIAKRPDHPQIRLMVGGPKPQWVSATADNVAGFSALLFSFGERLQRDLDVPIGLMVGAVGGTPSGSWIPPKTFANSELCKQSIAEFAVTYDPQAEQKKYESALADWNERVAKAKAEGTKARGRKPNRPLGPGTSSRGGKIGGLYERFIESMVGYRIRGVLWDQGEARSGVVGVDQFTMMTELIRGWREAWGQGDFPFLFVQKTSGGGCAFSNENPITRNGNPFTPQPTGLPKRPNRGRETIDRVMYTKLMQTNHNAWMVPASDLGSGIHPTNKWGYGNRAAEVALDKVYDEAVQAYGPIYRSHVIKGNQVIISFDETGKGLTQAHSDRLQGFTIAGADGTWHWADAKISGDTVVVSSEMVPEPQRVRFAYADDRSWANLFNQDGLPALAFETP
tara:strand:+ start:25825 stop:27423 length:1599 start_codon:yes stop_codon:yes gene_type:complete